MRHGFNSRKDAKAQRKRRLLDALRSAGHDVLWARTDLAGYSDDAILSRAQTGERVAPTFDKDFGELAYQVRLAGGGIAELAACPSAMRPRRLKER
ncbi:MAG: DUF5615 family PIN-like protein [Candidatus Hydrogenedentota bacterium]